MRTLSVLALAAFLPFSILAQSSTRLVGMGNVSIAVPDSQTELFYNPAQISRLGGVMIQAIPLCFPYNSTGSTYGSSTLPNVVSISSTENKFSSFETAVPLLATVSLDVLHVGGMASYGSASSSNTQRWTTQWSSSIGSTSEGNETSNSRISLQGFASLRLGPISLGGAARHGFNTGSMTSTTSSTSGASPTSSQTGHDTYEEPQSYQAGIYIGSPQSVEVSGWFETSSSRDEDKLNVPTFNGHSVVPGSPPTYYTSPNTELFGGMIRINLGKALLGMRAIKTSTTHNVVLKSNWYDVATPTSPVYAERPYSYDELTDWQYGVGLAWKVERLGTIAFEYLFAPATINTTMYFTTAGTRSDGSRYTWGDVQSTDEVTKFGTTLRGGAEVFVTEGFVVRAGSSLVWTSSDETMTDKYSFVKSTNNGQQNAIVIGHFGASFSLGGMRIDYALTIGQNPLSIHSPYSMALSYSQDVKFTHQATVTIVL